MITLATLSATGAPVVEAATNQPPGINSSAALDNPNCDADLEQVILKYYPVPCVVPWDGGDNGGETAPGVTADAIKVLVYATQPVDQPSTSATDLTRNLASGQKGNVRDAVFDVNAVFQNLETWGREIEFDFLVQTGTDEAARKADAVTALAMDPFLVLDLAGSEVFATEMAARKRMVISVSGTNQASAAQKPYRFSTSIDYRAMAVLIPELIAKGLRDRNAKWAGSDELQKQERKFGVVYSAGNAGLDIDQYNQALATWKAPKSAVELSFEAPVGGGTDAVTAAAQQAAPTMIARLKEQGVTSVVLFTASTLITPLLEQATSQDYHPEWITTGYGFQDLDILARGFDQEQFSHAFGLGVIRPAVLSQGASGAEPVFPWYWGPDNGTYNVQLLGELFVLRAGVHLAGPNLTAKRVHDALFKMPAAGGAFDDQVIVTAIAYGKKAKLPYDEYQFGGDAMLMWWNAEAEGPSNLLSLEGTGKFFYLDDAKHYLSGQLPKKTPKFFDESASIGDFATVPENDVLPDFACVDCPSSGGSQQPAAAS